MDVKIELYLKDRMLIISVCVSSAMGYVRTTQSAIGSCFFGGLVSRPCTKGESKRETG